MREWQFIDIYTEALILLLLFYGVWGREAMKHGPMSTNKNENGRGNVRGF